MIFDVSLNGSLEPVVDYILSKSDTHPIVLFQGDLGAGKTTLIKAIGTRLGIGSQMNSPSFGIVNSYDGPELRNYYHMDLYRLRQEEEAWDIGLFEILDSGSTCWIEWPEVLFKVWPNYDALNVKIEVNQDGSRRIFVTE